MQSEYCLKQCLQNFHPQELSYTFIIVSEEKNSSHLSASKRTMLRIMTFALMKNIALNSDCVLEHLLQFLLLFQRCIIRIFVNGHNK